MTTTTNQLAYKADESQIKKWKKEHGEVFLLSVPEANKACYLRPVDRKIAAFISQLGSDPMAYNESLLNNCWLAGDEEIKTDDKLFLSILSRLEQLMEFYDSKLEKL